MPSGRRRKPFRRASVPGGQFCFPRRPWRRLGLTAGTWSGVGAGRRRGAGRGSCMTRHLTRSRSAVACEACGACARGHGLVGGHQLACQAGRGPAKRPGRRSLGAAPGPGACITRQSSTFASAVPCDACHACVVRHGLAGSAPLSCYACPARRDPPPGRPHPPSAAGRFHSLALSHSGVRARAARMPRGTGIAATARSPSLPRPNGPAAIPSGGRRAQRGPQALIPLDMPHG